MTDHNKDDALDFIRTDVQRRLRLYKRRVQKEAELEYARLLGEQTRLVPDSIPDHIALAERALNEATKNWLGINAVPQRAIETISDSQAA